MANRDRNSGSNGPGWRTYAAVAVALVILIFIAQNAQEVEVDIAFATITTPLFFVIVLSAALGALIGWLLPHVRRDRRRERAERDRHDNPS